MLLHSDFNKSMSVKARVLQQDTAAAGGGGGGAVWWGPRPWHHLQQKHETADGDASSRLCPGQRVSWRKGRGRGNDGLHDAVSLKMIVDSKKLSLYLSHIYLYTRVRAQAQRMKAKTERSRVFFFLRIRNLFLICGRCALVTFRWSSPIFWKQLSVTQQSVLLSSRIYFKTPYYQQYWKSPEQTNKKNPNKQNHVDN